jgi:putative transposase
MARTARLVLPDFPHHIIQRGHNRTCVFPEDRDRESYLLAIRDLKIELGCKVYAYCLMGNHVHLVVDPGKDPDSLAKLMKRVAGRHAQRLNRKRGRTGTVWNGRFRSSPIETDQYLLACCRYVELNPVRAGIVPLPEMYWWSSYRDKIGLRATDWLDQDPCYMGLGRTRSTRETRYRGWVRAAVPSGEWNLLRSAVQHGWPTGSASFRAAVEQGAGRSQGSARRGRPRKCPGPSVAVLKKKMGTVPDF